MTSRTPHTREWEEITPHRLRCIIGGCPAVYRTAEGSYVLVGRALSEKEKAERLAGRIGPDETAVEIDADILDELKLGR